MLKSFAADQVTPFEQATSVRRLGARAIDLAFAFVILLPLSGISAVFGQKASMVLFYLTFLVLLLAYETLMTFFFGKTLGKIALGLRVVDTHGDKLTLLACLARAALLYLTIFVAAFLFFATATLLGWIFIRALPQYVRFPHEKATGNFVAREAKGRLMPSREVDAPSAKPDELERLRAQGLISAEEYARKKAEK
jgi:uncharacterized RDD family membrane protein YckC